MSLLTPIQLRAEAELHLRARRGDASVLPYLRGFGVYQSDPVLFCKEQLKTEFTEPIKKVIESVRDNPVTIAISANGVGKSFAAAQIATWFYKTHPGAKVITTAAPPISNLQTILWGEIGKIVRDHPNLFIDDVVHNDMNIKRDAETFITGIAIPSSGTPAEREAKFSGKHDEFLLFIVDEGDAVPLEVYKGIDSCMSGGMARLLIMFNPRADRGAVAQMVKKQQGNVIYLSAFEHPNVVTGEDVIPGAVSREVTVQRINEWSDPLPKGEKPDIRCYEVPAFLEGVVGLDKGGKPYPPIPAGWRIVTNPEFFYKVLGKYPPQSETQLISRAWIDAAVSRWQTYRALHGENPPKLVMPIVGLDVADVSGRDKSAMAQRWGGWVAPIRIWSENDPDSIAIKSYEVIKSLGVSIKEVKIKVDGTGVGAGVAPRMQRLGATMSERVMVASSPSQDARDEFGNLIGIFPMLRDQLWWMVMLWIKKDPGAMIPPDEDLIEELVTPTYEVYNGKVRIMHKDEMKEYLGRSPDKAESLILTFAPDAQKAGAW